MMAEMKASGEQSVTQQLALIESMIREGRQSTQYWGWNFVLWGVSYLVALTWGSALADTRSAYWAWPVTMTVSGIATYLIARWRNRGNPETLRSRAISGVWMAAGFGIAVFAFSSILAHRLGDGHTFIAAIETLLGVAHLTSGVVLRWRLQILVGLGWWVAAVISTFTQSAMGVLVPFVAGTIVLSIGFGLYLMYLESRDKARLRAGQVIHV
jgi:hypothetical protein